MAHLATRFGHPGEAFDKVPIKGGVADDDQVRAATKVDTSSGLIRWPADHRIRDSNHFVTAHLPPPDNALRAILARNHGFGGRKLAQNPRN